MASIKMEVGFDPAIHTAIRSMGKYFGEINYRALGFVGARAKKILLEEYLSGPEMRLRRRGGKAVDIQGRRTVNYSIKKRSNYVMISSYPMNLFEKGRLLRSGRREAGKYIVTRKFKSAMDSRLQGIVDQFDRNILQEIIDKVIEEKKSSGLKWWR